MRFFVPFHRNRESYNLSSNNLRITKLTKLLRKRNVEEQLSEPPIPEEDSPEHSFGSIDRPKGFTSYCKQTSLHGWKYVAFSKGSKFERVCWLFLLLLALLIASNLVYR